MLSGAKSEVDTETSTPRRATKRNGISLVASIIVNLLAFPFVLHSFDATTRTESGTIARTTIVIIKAAQLPPKTNRDTAASAERALSQALASDVTVPRFPSLKTVMGYDLDSLVGRATNRQVERAPHSSGAKLANAHGDRSNHATPGRTRPEKFDLSYDDRFRGVIDEFNEHERPATEIRPNHFVAKSGSSFAFNPANSPWTAENWPLPENGLFAHAKIIRTKTDAAAIRTTIRVGKKWICVGYYVKITTRAPADSPAGPYVGLCHRDWLAQLGLITDTPTATPTPTIQPPESPQPAPVQTAPPEFGGVRD